MATAPASSERVRQFFDPLCKDTIDEHVAELQDRKRALVSSVFTATEAARLGTLSLDDVEALLQ